MGILKERIAIDLGTTYSVVAHESSEGLWCIPSSVALDSHTKEPVAFGDQAKSMMGKGTTHYEVVRPLKDGVISDFEAAGHYLSYLVNKSRKNPLALQYSVLVCVPWGATAVETKSYIERIQNMRTELRLIREPFAAALGCDEDIFSPQGCTLMDIGGGTVEISTIGHGHMIQCHSIREAGNVMDQTIVERMLRQRFFEVGLNTAEEIKIKYGSVFPVMSETTFEVLGLDRKIHGPGRCELSTEELREYLEPIAFNIENQVKDHLRLLPPEFQATVATKGLLMVGGGSHLRGWKERLEANLGIQIRMPDDPRLAVIRGMQRIMREPKKYEPILKISENVSEN